MASVCQNDQNSGYSKTTEDGTPSSVWSFSRGRARPCANLDFARPRAKNDASSVPARKNLETGRDEARPVPRGKKNFEKNFEKKNFSVENRIFSMLNASEKLAKTTPLHLWKFFFFFMKFFFLIFTRGTGHFF